MWMGLGHEEDDHHKLSWADGPKTPSWWIYWWYWWSLGPAKKGSGVMEFSQPNELGYSVHSDAWFLHFNRSVLRIKVQQEEEEIRKKDDFHRVFMNRRDSPPDERRVFHYQNVWFPDTFINYWVIIASLNHFDPQISFRLCQNPSNSSLSGGLGLVW